MDKLNKLNKDSQLVIFISNQLSEYYNESNIKNIHILMSITYLNSITRKKLNSYDISFENIENLFYRKKEEPFTFDPNEIKAVGAIAISYSTLVCIERAIASKEGTTKLVSPNDLLIEIIKHDDPDVMSILDSKIENLGEFIDYLESASFRSSRSVDLSSNKQAKSTGSRSSSSYPNLRKYATDLIEEARSGRLDNLSGREKEVSRLIEILGRKKKSNPCLVGEAGVGKTAIVEGLAVKIKNKEVPDFLKNVTIFSLEMGSLMAGTKYRGEFEAKMEAIIKEAKDDPNIILFFDEIHNIINSGMSEGAIDTGNILKPYLARGSIKCIGATTNKEYRNNIEKDSALERRFQKISVQEPSVKECINIIEEVKDSYEEYHNISIPKLVVKAAVTLSDRYITDRLLPDKAFDLIDEACSKVKLKKSRTKLFRQDIIDVIQSWTGIAVESISSDTNEKILKLSENLKENVIGQEEAIDVVYKTLLRSQAGFRDATKPIGSFIFSGPTGVGKTELAKNLSKFLFDSEKNLIRIDMSEYSDKISVSKLIGAAPGYVGYKEGGQLSEAVKNKPYSVVLIDEIEKAHPEVLNIFLQILDDGRLTDGLGRTINFKNTILIFTSNLYNPHNKKNKIGFPVSEDKSFECNAKKEAIKAFSSTFSPEFVNRFDDIIVFNKLNKDNMYSILEILINDISKKASKKGIELVFSKKAKDFLIEKCDYSSMGARPLKRVITKYIEDPLSMQVLSGEIVKGTTVKIGVKDDDISFSKAKSNKKEKELSSVTT